MPPKDSKQSIRGIHRTGAARFLLPVSGLAREDAGKEWTEIPQRTSQQGPCQLQPQHVRNIVDSSLWKSPNPQLLKENSKQLQLMGSNSTEKSEARVGVSTAKGPGRKWTIFILDCCLNPYQKSRMLSALSCVIQSLGNNPL